MATLPSPITLPLATTPTPLPLTSMPLPQTPTPSPATPTPPPLTPTPLLLTSTPLHPTPTPPAPTPDTVVATVEDLVFTDVTGTWKTDYGTMKLEQDGSAVTGTYTTDSGVIIDATISGRTLTGFWVEDASAANCGSAKDDRNFWGRISFEFDEDFTSFKGKWRWCEQDPTENWNGKRIPTPLATHFIAVADRGVGTSASPVFHYSLEYWQCGGDFSPLHHMPSFTPAQIVEKCSAFNSPSEPQQLGGIELLARMGWAVWAGGFRPGGTAKSWIETQVWISEIMYTGTAATKIMPIYTGSAADVQARWATITDIATSYTWGEQSGFSSGSTQPAFAQWPRSWYKSLQTNSNTFVRQLVTRSGVTMTEMSGSHPGDELPSPNEEMFVGRPLTMYAAQTPWKYGGPFRPESPSHLNLLLKSHRSSTRDMGTTRT